MHPSAQLDALTAARHRAFIAPRLLGSVIALAALPIYLILRGAPSTIELIVFAWLAAPILTAFFLSRTGRYEGVHVLSAIAMTGLVAVVAAETGGIDSFAAVWLAVVPFEAALSASRRAVATAATLALGAAGLLLLLGALDLLPAPDPRGQVALAALGIVTASLYATGLALGAEEFARLSLWLLYAEEDRYRLLARNMTDAITRHGRDGGVLFASPAAESLFACRIFDLHGNGLFDRVHVIDRPAYLTALGDAAAFGESRSVEFRVQRESADPADRPATQFVWVEMRCRPLERATAGADGQGAGEVVAILRDITERRRQEEEIAQARAAAESANDCKSRFVAIMAHQLRTPLNAIIGFAEMLIKDAALTLDARRRNEYAGLIKDRGHHLLAAINGILDMSKIETDNFEIMPEPLAPAPVIASCCDLLEPRAREAGVRLDKVAPEDLPEMIADKRALNQILLNVLSNAIRFTDRGGKVTLSARAEAATIIFVVEDNGVGMSKHDLARVGEPYFRARASCEGGGSGLGLCIAKGLVRLHGGEMSIRSRVGEGTRVTVRLPHDCERARPAKKHLVRAAVWAASHRAGRVTAELASNMTAERLGQDAALRTDIQVKKSA